MNIVNIIESKYNDQINYELRRILLTHNFEKSRYIYDTRYICIDCGCNILLDEYSVNVLDTKFWRWFMLVVNVSNDTGEPRRELLKRDDYYKFILDCNDTIIKDIIE